MMKEKVFFRTPKGLKLCGMLEGPDKPKAGVLLISGYASGKDEWGGFMIRYAAALNKAGFLTLRFDRAGIGESEGEFADCTMETELGDCIAAYNFLKEKCGTIGIAGQSMGGALAVMLAAKTMPKAVVASATVAVPSEVMKTLFTGEEITMLKKKGEITIPKDWEEHFNVKFFGWKYWKTAADFGIAKYAASVAAPALVIHGTADEYVPIQHGKLVFNSLKCMKKFEAIEGASHGFEEHEDTFFKLATDWFKKYL
ncbi:MAG: alpha/beta fold hydrolase [Candidatus Aenigmatarchaeota archaeon]